MAREPVTVIGISGLVATGKGTISKRLAERLRWPRHSGGDSLRAIQKARGMTHLRPDEFAKQTPGIDIEIERMNRDFVAENIANGCVIEGRLVLEALRGFSGTYSVLLTCDDEICIDREIKRAAENGIRLTTPQVRANVLRRNEEDRKRYDACGFPDFLNPDLYDLEVNTGKWSEVEIVDMIMFYARKTWSS